jgi:nicotinamide-nucleotide adenylyltransferase
MRALFIARFQPLHLGHLKAIEYLSKRYSQLTIAIGSSNKKNKDNPLSARDRLMLLKQSTKRFHNLRFIFLADSPSNTVWTAKVKRRFRPDKYIICSMNPLVNSLLTKAGYSFDTLPYKERHILEGKKIRKLIRDKKSYKNRIPSQIIVWMEQKGEKKIRELTPQ